MTTLTCPRCRGDNAVAVGAPGYVCRQCATTWRFVTCASCHTTWHAGPEVTAWTCKRCGHHNVGEAGAAAGPGAGPLPAAGGTPAGGQQSALAGLGDRWRRLGPRGKGIALLVPVLLIVLIVVLVSAGGGSSNSKLAEAHQALCQDVATNLRNVEALRIPQLSRFRDALATDAAELRKLGDRTTAAAVARVRAVTVKLIADLTAHRTTTATLGKLLTARQALHC